MHRDDEGRVVACRVAPHLGRRVGGQGAVVFAQHVNSPSSLYALKFFFLGDVFEVERSAACDDVRYHTCIELQLTCNCVKECFRSAALMKAVS